VIGVAADGFDGLQFDGTVDIIVPFALMRLAAGDPFRPIRSRQLVGRLARGVSIDAARAELLARWPSVQSATLPATVSETEREALLRQRVNVAPLASGFSGLRSQYGTTLWVLLALMGILLVVACANLAGLILARSLTRRHQVAIRLALGGKPVARVLAGAARRASAGGGGVRRCGPAGVGEHPGCNGIPPVRSDKFEVSDADA
jgi:putative ABC transport system permease protein